MVPEMQQFQKGNFCHVL